MANGLYGRVRVVIENVTPRVDCGEFPVKRVVGERVVVETDAFTDGHDAVSVRLLARHTAQQEWQSIVMAPLGNDRWRGDFTVERQGQYLYTVRAWVDHYETWRRDLAKRHAAAQPLGVDLLRGAELLRACAARARGRDATRLAEGAKQLADESRSDTERYATGLEDALAALASEHADPDTILERTPPYGVMVDRERARFSTWYEFFPRSVTGETDRHGSFGDCQARLPYVAAMGFDVLYFPPIHPIGRSRRKGPNNAPEAAPEDPGSPWGIGAAEGGHKSIHPQLGTLAEFRELLAAAERHGLEIALDIAFQCSPDHPYVREHPEWFRKRPDGSVQYAENPPKKYQDIYPFDFESPEWRALWDELKSVVDFWIEQGVRIFRVDNPHTKPFAMWQWLIAEVKQQHPEVLFLSEAFTRPKVMYRLAKAGFTQSYTYFAWRNSRHELESYFTELTQTPVREFFRPNLWPNTPDILTEHLQFGGRPMFMARATLAATLGASYGIYGPAFELLEHEPREPGSEEYRDSEKYQIRAWDLDEPQSLRDFVTRLNRIRRENLALQSDWRLRFHRGDNDMLICYSKSTEDLGNVVLTVVNLDPRHAQSGWLELDLDALGVEPEATIQMHDLLSGARFLWRGARNFVSLDPAHGPAHVFVLRRRTRTERDFDYFL
jgi:starch synthase (maltosyl-transferring)